MSSVVYKRQDRIAFIVVDNPLVNALSQSVRGGCLECLQRALKEDQAHVLVLLCLEQASISNTDLQKLGKPMPEPALKNATNTHERCKKRVIAVIHRDAVGGGLVVALGRHHRIIHSDVDNGLPQVKLALLPEADGAHRLPRWAAVGEARNVILSDELVCAVEAKQYFIDDGFEGDAQEAGKAFALRLLQDKRGLRRNRAQRIALDRANTVTLIANHVQVAGQRRNLFSPIPRIRAAESAIALHIARGHQRQQALLDKRMHSSQYAVFIHVSGIEWQCRRQAGLVKNSAIRSIRSVVIVGTVTREADIGRNFAKACLLVKLLKLKKTFLIQVIGKLAQKFFASLKFHSAPQRRYSVENVLHHRYLSDADLTIEDAAKDMNVKRRVFKRLDRICELDAVLASKIFSLNINVIASFTRQSRKVIGLLFISRTADLTLEVAQSHAISIEVLATAMMLKKTLNQVRVSVGDASSFDWMICQYPHEVQLEEDAALEQIESALHRFGIRSELLAMNLSGRAFRQHRKAVLAAACTDGLDRLSWLVKSHDDAKNAVRFVSGATARIDPAVSRTVRGRNTRYYAFDNACIVERTIYALINEVTKILEKAPVQPISDMNVLHINGYGSSRWRGRSVFNADTLGLAPVLK